jgi:hypothetical protein
MAWAPQPDFKLDHGHLQRRADPNRVRARRGSNRFYRSNSGSLAMLAAMRRAWSRVSSLAVARLPGSFSYHLQNGLNRVLEGARRQRLG